MLAACATRALSSHSLASLLQQATQPASRCQMACACKVAALACAVKKAFWQKELGHRVHCVRIHEL